MPTIVLRGWCKVEGELESVFTLNERKAAIHVARNWAKKGLQPFCYVQGHNFEVLYDWKARRRKAA